MTLQNLEDTRLVPMYNKRDIALVRGEGYWLWDNTGKQYYDFASNYGVNILGHSNPAVTEAICSQAGKLLSCHQSFYNDTRASYIEKLTSVLPADLSKIFFNNSGAESIEAALKFARAATGRVNIVAAKRGYHGRTYGALSATADKKYREAYEPLVPGFSHVTYGDADELAQAINTDTAAIILEPVQGESGVHPAPDGYLKAARKLTKDTGTLLIFDEVQTGFRTGKHFAFEHAGIVPDILCLSKGIANGVPMGVTVTSEAISDALPKGTHGNTFGGAPLAAAAATAVLSEIERNNLLAHSVRVGNYMLEQLSSIESPKIREVRGLGLMIAVELRDRATKYLRGLQEQGFIALPAGATSIRFLPPLVIDEQAVDALVASLAELLGAGQPVG